MNAPLVAAPAAVAMAPPEGGQLPPAIGVPQQQAMGMSSGFQIWSPSAPPPETYFGVFGSDFSQILELTVNPGEVVTAEPRTMLFMTPGLEMDADIGGLGQGCKRCCCAGESFFRLKLHNRGTGVERVGLTPAFPAKVVPVDLSQHSGLAMNKGAFLGAKGTGWRINIEMVRGLGVCCCAGQGLFLNRLSGDGIAFLNGGGSVIMNQLEPGEEMVIDPHSLLAMERTVRLGIRRTGGLMVCCCGGQGLFNAVLTGPGWVLLHSMPLEKMRKAIGVANGAKNNNEGAQAAGEGAAGVLQVAAALAR